MCNTSPVLTGFGLIMISLITGAEVSNVTVLVTLDAFPAASVAVITIVFAPSASVSVVLKA